MSGPPELTVAHFGDHPDLTHRHNRTRRRHWQQDEHLTFTFVTDGVESAVAQAKAAAGANGDKAVQVVGGVSVAQQLFAARLVDELHVDIMPVFLGSGLRSFQSASLERVRLEKISVQEFGARTSFRFRIRQ